jgi:hypothetical protein
MEEMDRQIMKIIERNIAKGDVVLTETDGTIVIQSGDAYFIIREVDPARLVVLCPESDPGETVYRMFIEPISGHAFQITEWVQVPESTGNPATIKKGE